MALLSNISVEKELRLCIVNEEIGYFHCWEQYADVISPGLTIGSHPGGQFSKLFGIVEFEDRIERVDPSKIRFVDEKHDVLVVQAKNMPSLEKENPLK